MAGIESVNTINEYPDESVPFEDRDKIVVRNHWNHRDRVVVVIDGKEHIVLAVDLRNAINNAVGAHR